MAEPLSRYEYAYIDFNDPRSLLAYAKKLEGHTFQEVLDLGITPDGLAETNDYSSRAFKGGMGNLIEERYFGYRANSDARADFHDAGVELKTTCYDTRADGSVRAGERLVLGMIAYDESIEAALEDSHMWEKGGNVLLIYYGRDKSVGKYDQRIDYAVLFTPPEADMAVIREDYETIQRYVTEGRADELSESLTHYLGACTKGATAAKSMRDQRVYAPGRLARGRAWCYKNSYMDAVLHDYVIGDAGGESIVKDPAQLVGRTFEEYVVSLLDPYIGMRDAEIAEALGLEAGPKNKSFWRMIAYRLLGLGGERAEEFEKANVKARTVRMEANGTVRESFPLPPFHFKELAAEDEWEESELFGHFDETRYFFTVFEGDGEGYRLKGARFWSMPAKDVEGPLQECWRDARDKVRGGVTFTKRTQRGGKVVISNDLPGIADNPVAHVRPHTSKSAYKLADGTEFGDLGKDADELPDGQWMTKQSFWLNSKYVYEIVKVV